MKKKTVGDIPKSRCNDIINAVNNKQPPESVYPPMDEVELEWFREMEKYKKEEDEKYGLDLCYAPVEIDYDDPRLDIYRDDVWKRK